MHYPCETINGIITVTQQVLRKFAVNEKYNSLLKESTLSYEKLKNGKWAIFLINKEEEKSLMPIIAAILCQLNIFIAENMIETTFILDNVELLEKPFIEKLATILGNTYKGIQFIISTRDINLFGAYFHVLATFKEIV